MPVSLLFSDFSPKADVAYKNIRIQQQTTTTELIQLAMQKFGIEVQAYCIIVTRSWSQNIVSVEGTVVMFYMCLPVCLSAYYTKKKFTVTLMSEK